MPTWKKRQERSLSRGVDLTSPDFPLLDCQAPEGTEVLCALDLSPTERIPEVTDIDDVSQILEALDFGHLKLCTMMGCQEGRCILKAHYRRMPCVGGCRRLQAPPWCRPGNLSIVETGTLSQITSWRTGSTSRRTCFCAGLGSVGLSEQAERGVTSLLRRIDVWVQGCCSTP